MLKNNYKKELKKFGKVIVVLLSLSHQTAKANHSNLKFNIMKIAAKKLYMNIQGNLFTAQQAKEYYGARFETAILEKVIVKNSIVIGSWT